MRMIQQKRKKELAVKKEITQCTAHCTVGHLGKWSKKLLNAREGLD